MKSNYLFIIILNLATVFINLLTFAASIFVLIYKLLGL